MEVEDARQAVTAVFLPFGMTVPHALLWTSLRGGG